MESPKGSPRVHMYMGPPWSPMGCSLDSEPRTSALITVEDTPAREAGVAVGVVPAPVADPPDIPRMALVGPRTRDGAGSL